MAKVSARGASKIDSFDVPGIRYTFTSDGRVLAQYRIEATTYTRASWTGHKVKARNVTSKAWEQFKELRIRRAEHEAAKRNTPAATMGAN